MGDTKIAADPLVPEVLPPEGGHAAAYKRRIQDLLMVASHDASKLAQDIARVAQRDFANADEAFYAIMDFQNRGLQSLENALQIAYKEYEKWEEGDFQQSERGPRPPRL
jgi:hypothetical protein